MFAILFDHLSPMKILLSNDDGYHAEGLAVLAREVSALAETVIVAPDRNQSGASHSLTLDSPLRVTTTPNGIHYVSGTPTDCVHLAITGLLEIEPDMVVAGIKGRFLGLPAIAVSLVSETPTHFVTAAKAVCTLIRKLENHPLPADTILNVNVPDRPYDELRGFQATRLGFRHRAEPVVKSADPKGRPIFWVGPAGAGQDAGPGTDFHAVREGYVSVTPIQIDLTRYDAIEPLGEWLEF
jgi:5'-nucleotidase